MNNFKYALSLLDTLYGILMNEDTFEEIAIHAWNHIGNKRTKIHKYSVCVKDCDEGVELPCDADMLEGVTIDGEEINTLKPGMSSSVENYIESAKRNPDPLYLNGRFIKYERVGNMLYFNLPYAKVNILYRSLILDEDGLPEITDKEALAIATFCAYTAKFKEGLMTSNSNMIQMANILKLLWNTQVDLARIDYYMSLNEWDEVLNMKTDHDRKLHNKSYKIYR